MYMYLCVYKCEHTKTKHTTHKRHSHCLAFYYVEADILYIYIRIYLRKCAFTYIHVNVYMYT